MPKVLINPRLCKGCSLCIEVCPKKLLRPSEEVNAKGVHYIVSDSPDQCTGCKLCVVVCPDVAIEILK